MRVHPGVFAFIPDLKSGDAGPPSIDKSARACRNVESGHLTTVTHLE